MGRNELASHRRLAANVLAWADTIQMRDGYAVTRELPPKGAPLVQLDANESSTAKVRFVGLILRFVLDWTRSESF